MSECIFFFMFGCNVKVRCRFQLPTFAGSGEETIMASPPPWTPSGSTSKLNMLELGICSELAVVFNFFYFSSQKMQNPQPVTYVYTTTTTFNVRPGFACQSARALGIAQIVCGVSLIGLQMASFFYAAGFVFVGHGFWTGVIVSFFKLLPHTYKIEGR